MYWFSLTTHTHTHTHTHSTAYKYSPTIHAMTKLFVPFCSAQNNESTDMNCLVFWVHCKNGKIWTNHQVYNKGISPILGSFSKYEILISLESTVDSQMNDVVNSVVSCLIAEFLIHREITRSSFQWLTHHNSYKISQQPYMLQQNCLYHSVQLQMVSLMIWFV